MKNKSMIKILFINLMLAGFCFAQPLSQCVNFKVEGHIFSVAYRPEITSCKYDLYKNINLSWLEECLVSQYKTGKISPYQFYTLLARLLVNDNEVIKGEPFHLHGDNWFDIQHWNYTASRLLECIEMVDTSGKLKSVFIDMFRSINLWTESGHWKNVKINPKQRLTLIQDLSYLEDRIAKNPDFLNRHKIGESYGPPCNSVQINN